MWDVTPEVVAPAVRTAAKSPAWSARLLFGAQILSLLIMTGTMATRWWQDNIVAAFALTAVATALWVPEFTRGRARVWWYVYVAGIFFYTLLRSLADETGVAVQTGYVIGFDKALFLGNDPTLALQQRLFDPGDVSVVDWLAVSTHWSFFVAPHAAAVAVFLLRRELFPRFAVAMVGTWYAGLVLFFALPTTPPWLAGVSGELPGALRVMDFVGGSVSSDTYRKAYETFGEPNSVAAMPSLHMAITFILCLWALEHHRRWAPGLAIYGLLMAFALVYLAEHYVTDVLVGMAVAGVCYAATRRLVPVAAHLRNGRSSKASGGATIEAG